jgi:hypothetical protein
MKPSHARYLGPPPEPSVNPQTTLGEALRTFLACQALPPTTPELIDQLVYSTSRGERLQLATLIARSAP